jgi:hypothetical protein
MQVWEDGQMTEAIELGQLWVTMSGMVPAFPHTEGVILEFPAFGAPVVGRK